MIHLTATTPILVAIEPTDMRLGIDGLAARCKHHFKRDPRNGTLFVFINRRRTMVRILAYESNGFWIMSKRLSRSRFDGWPKSGNPLQSMDAVRLRRILSAMIAEQSPERFPIEKKSAGQIAPTALA